MATGDNQAPAPDASRWRKGVGKSAWRLFRLVCGVGSIEVDAVAHRFAVRREQVIRLARRLEQLGLVTRDGVTLRRGAATVEEAGARCGAAGAGLLQRAGHELERAAYRDARNANTLKRAMVLETVRNLGWPSRLSPRGVVIMGREEAWRSFVSAASRKMLDAMIRSLTQDLRRADSSGASAHARTNRTA